MNFLKIQNSFKGYRARLYSLLLKGSAGAWGQKTIIHPPFHSNNIRQVFLGKHCSIHAAGWVYCISRYAGKEYSPHIEIGDNTYIGHRVHIIACGKMTIGRHVMIADGVYISDNLHGFEDISLPIMQQPLKHPGTVTIEDEVWIGENVAILPNVTIGKHSVIGANSVVTKDVPEYCVAAGVPAKIIKRYNKKSKTWEKGIFK